MMAGKIVNVPKIKGLLFKVILNSLSAPQSKGLLFYAFSVNISIINWILRKIPILYM